MTVYAVPGTIASDGSVDVTVDLEDFIEGVPNGSAGSPNIITFQTGGRYRIEDTIWISGRSHLKLDGRSALLYATNPDVVPRIGDTANRSQVTIDSCSDIEIVRLDVTGCNPNPGVYNATYFGQHGYRFRASDQITIHDLNITNTYGDYIYFGSVIEAGCGTVHVYGIKGSGAGRQGIGCVHAANVLIEGNNLSLIGRSVLDFEPASGFQSVDVVRIRYNTFSTWTNSSVTFSAGAGVTSAYVGYNLAIGKPMGIGAALTAPRSGGDLIFEHNYSSTVIATSQNCNLSYWDTALIQDNVAVIRASPASAFVAADNVVGSLTVINNFCKDANPVVNDQGGNGTITQSGNTTTGSVPAAAADVGEAGLVRTGIRG